jgi:periplasmic glucans biosynthesis protein
VSVSRRRFLTRAGAAITLAVGASPILAQGANPGTTQPSAPVTPQAPRFSYDVVVRRARELAAMAFDGTVPPLPETLSKLDFDGYRDIRFRPDRALLTQSGSAFRMQMFHPGFLFNRTVTINVVRDGLATPVPYSAQLFDYGRTRIERPLPVNLGFAGFRLHYPLNDPRVSDELVAFIGASYFRVLGRDQRYGLSARGLAMNAGGSNEEFPFFREFWIETPGADADRITIHALLDGAATTGAFQFIIYPKTETAMEVTATLFPRRTLNKVGIAPLTSMFFTGENERRSHDDYRPELHDSDGLLMQSGNGEWIWRPLRNPSSKTTMSAFVDKDIKGFGLMQRDRIFEHYQDLDLAYEMRPSYWIEPRGNWGEGHVELVEIPTSDETNDNIVASWVPKQPLEPGREVVFRYGLRSLKDESSLHSGGHVINTYQTTPKALGSSEAVPAGARRFILDFTGGDLSHYLTDPDQVKVVPSISQGRILRTFVVPNANIRGFRAGIDVQVEPGQSADLRAFLKVGSRALTETWTMPWSPT